MNTDCTELAKNVANKLTELFKETVQPTIFISTIQPFGTNKVVNGLIIRFPKDEKDENGEDKKVYNHSKALEWLYENLPKYPDIFFQINKGDDRSLYRKDFTEIL
jgi:hypothetical protein